MECEFSGCSFRVTAGVGLNGPVQEVVVSAPVSAPAVTSAPGRSERPAACVLFDSGRLSVFKNPLQSDVNL